MKRIKRFELVDENGNPKNIDLFALLKQINDNAEIKEDGTIVFHLPPKKENSEQNRTKRNADGISQ